jgi:hypothetical protein
MYAPPVWLIVLGAGLVGLVVAGALYAWPPTREGRRIVVGSVAAVAAFLLWRSALIIADGANFDVDYPVLLGLSFEDIGSGVMAFLFAALAFGLGTDRAQPAQLVVKSAAIVATAVMLVDRFV